MPGQSASTGAQRHADRDLSLALDRASKQEIGDVGAGDQQHEPARRGEPNRELRVAADVGSKSLVHGAERHSPAGIAGLDKSAAVDRGRLGGCLYRIDAGTEPGDDPRKPEVPGAQGTGPHDLRGRRCERHPEVRYLELNPRKALGCHTDHGVHVAPQLQGLSEHRMVRAEPAPPKLPAQHRDMRGASHTVLVSAEKAPQHRADAE